MTATPRDILLRELATARFPEAVGMADQIINALAKFGYVIVPVEIAPVNWGPVVLDSEEFAEFELRMTSPQRPTESILQGAALANRLYIKPS